ncbi:MAG: DUF4091 domain-containing protein [Bacteroidales bacterium]|jgi:hypothetical protein|nr:DUF4091 domain-containing protein [Bacteroidales bacterium]
MRSFTLLLSIMFILFTYSCRNSEPVEKIFTEAEDPAGIDMADWTSVSAGLNSGFGDTDTRYSRSVPPGGKIFNELSLSGWKGEKVHCQLLFWSASDEGEVSLSALSEQGNATFPLENIVIRTVGYVLADEYLDGCGSRDNDAAKAHLVADRLDNKDTFTLPGMQTRPVWISIPIPPGTQAGNYSFSIEAISANDTLRHNIRLEVQDRLLPPPEDRSFHLDLWQNPFAVARYHEVDPWSEEHMRLLRPLLTMLAGAGQKCITASITTAPWGGQTYDPFGSMITWIKNSEGYWDYDYSVFDQYVRLAFECGIDKQINCYSMVPWDNKYSWFDQDSGKFVSHVLLPGSDEYIDTWKPFLRDFRVHLMEMGWFDKTVIAMDERGLKEMKDLLDLINEEAPGFEIALAGHYYEDVNSDIYDFSYNWNDISDFAAQQIQERKDRDMITTYYVSCSVAEPNTFTFSPPAESCYLGWFAAAMDFDGFLRWAYNSWPEKPLYDSRFIRWPSGDTYLVYPDARSSIRFERLIEGIQDYEKISILKQELAMNPSMEAAEAEIRISRFLSAIGPNSLDSIPAHEITSEGRQMLEEISRIK